MTTFSFDNYNTETNLPIAHTDFARTDKMWLTDKIFEKYSIYARWKLNSVAHGAVGEWPDLNAK